jgi:type VI secretion system protein ImpH
MSTTSRRKSPSIIGQLTHNPAQFQFLQAVRLLQRADHAKQRSVRQKPLEIAQYAPSTKEFIRFNTDTRLSFAASEITSIIEPKKRKGKELVEQWRLTVAFMGLTGMGGVLPYHYSESILRQLKNKNPSLLEFLELFNHRTISLFYRASTKYKLPVQYEKGKFGVLKNEKDDFTQSLLSIIGMGTGNTTNRLLTKDESLLRYSGLLSQSVRTSSGLRRMLGEHFGYPITIEEFQGQWQELLPDMRSRLSGKEYPRGCNANLGNNAKLGSKGWFMQGKIRISIGPLNTKEFDTLAPGSRKLAALKELVRFYVGVEQDFEINIMLKRSDLSKPLTLNKENRPIMGWNTWFANKNIDKAKEETIKIRLAEYS